MAKKPPRIAGSVYPADKDGFRRFLEEANRVERDGYELVTVVGLDAHIGAVFRRRVVQADATNNSFFE